VKFLFDTNICIAILKNSELPLIQKIKSHQPMDFALCSIVKAELLYGARKSQNVEKNLSLLGKLFAQFSSLPFDDQATGFYGTTRAILEKTGTPIGEADLFISSIALAHDLVVLTRNYGEFVRVPGLKVETW
jgi:tRNA(fMet)-specific endonuclease VapC